MIFSRRGTRIEDYPAVLNYLAGFRARLEPRPENWSGDKWPGRKPGPYQWFELQDTVNYWETFEHNHIIWQDLSYHSRFCFCPGGIYPEATCFSLASSDKWLLAVLNSPLLWCWLWRKTIHGKDEVLRLKNIYTEQIPVASPTDDMRGRAGSIVTRLAEIANLQFGAQKTILDWLKVEYGIEKPSNKLLPLTDLKSNALASGVKHIRSKRHALSTVNCEELGDPLRPGNLGFVDKPRTAVQDSPN